MSYRKLELVEGMDIGYFTQGCLGYFRSTGWRSRSILFKTGSFMADNQ